MLEKMVRKAMVEELVRKVMETYRRVIILRSLLLIELRGIEALLEAYPWVGIPKEPTVLIKMREVIAVSPKVREDRASVLNETDRKILKDKDMKRITW